MAEIKIICLQTTLKILSVYGIFPRKGTELDPGKYYYIKFAILTFFCSIALIGSFLHLIQSVRAGTYTSLDADLIYTLSLGATFLFSFGFVYKSEALAEIFVFLSDFKEFGKPTDFDENNEFYSKLSLFHYIYLEILICAQIILSTYLNTRACKKFNAEYGLHEICGLFSYTWMPFDIDYFPTKQLFLIVQAFGVHHYYMFAGMCSWFVLETVQHIRMRIRHANFLFQEAITETDPKICREKFNHAVRYHSSILSFDDKMNGAFGIFMFTHMAITAPIIGTGVFALLSGRPISTFLVCVGWLGGLALDCFAGQWLQDESFAIGYDLYQTDWTHCNDDLKRDIMMVVRRSWTPMLLRASSFGVMDYRMFLAVLKGSYSYITLLTQT